MLNHAHPRQEPSNRVVSRRALPDRSKSTAERWPSRVWSTLGLSIVLGFVVMFTFLPALKCPFLSYDDPDYVTSNPRVKAGLSWAGLRWALSSTEAGNWHAMTWLSHMLDCQLYGLNPWGHHLTNLLFHAANTLLVFLVLRGPARRCADGVRGF